MENLENLSNADLRAKCIQYGLPNIPITNSSRNVLIRKLRTSMSNANVAPQKNNRRETIHVLKKSSKEGLVTDGRTTACGPVRRTISGASKREDQRTLNDEAEGLNNEYHNVHGKGQLTKRKSKEKDNPIVVIESDIEEDNNLLMAVDKVEKMYNEKNTSGTFHSRTSRSVSLSKSDSTQGAMTLLPTINEKTSTSKANVMSGESTISSNPGILDKCSEMVESYKLKLKPETRTSHTNSQYSRFYVNSPSKNYNVNHKVAEGPTYSTILLNSKNKSNFNNSNDTENEQSYETPYLSDFARKLERLKVGSAESKIGYGPSNYESKLLYKHKEDFQFHSNKDSVKESLRRWLIAADRKYNLRSYFMLITVFLVLVFCYVLIFQ